MCSLHLPHTGGSDWWLTIPFSLVGKRDQCNWHHRRRNTGCGFSHTRATRGFAGWNITQQHLATCLNSAWQRKTYWIGCVSAHGGSRDILWALNIEHSRFREWQMSRSQPCLHGVRNVCVYGFSFSVSGYVFLWNYEKKCVASFGISSCPYGAK